MIFVQSESEQQLLHWQQEGTHQLAVTCDLDYRYLWIDQQCQSQLLLSDPSRICYPHLQWLFAQLPPRLPNLLQFGLGGGEFNRALAQRSPATRLLTVESSAAVINLYQQYFQGPRSTEQLHCQEAGAFLHQAQQEPQQYALIFVDLYPTPAAIVTWLPLLFNVLAADGHIWLNITEPSLVNAIQQQSETLQERWPHQLRIQQVSGYLNQLCLLTRMSALAL